MKRSVSISVSVYSPRWGHDDRYSITLTEKKLHSSCLGTKVANCARNEDGEYKWSGHNAKLGNPFVNMLEDDAIFPPSIFVSAIESAWEAWIAYEIKDEELKQELVLLFNWITVCAKNNPRSTFWNKIF